MRSFLVIAVLGIGGYAAAQTLSTAAPNNGSGGIFLDLTPNAGPLLVQSFDSAFSGVVGTTAVVEVWTRPGSYAGFVGSSVGWTLHETTSAVRAGALVLSNIGLVTPIALASGTTAVHLANVSAAGGEGIRYTGTSTNPPQTLWSNADLTLFSDVARTGGTPFVGGTFTPRTFAGNVNYAPVPEPASLAVLGLGAALLRRRRKA